MQKEQGNFLSIVEETLGGLAIIKAFFAEERFYQKFAASTHRFFKLIILFQNILATLPFAPILPGQKSLEPNAQTGDRNRIVTAMKNPLLNFGIQYLSDRLVPVQTAS